MNVYTKLLAHFNDKIRPWLYVYIYNDDDDDDEDDVAR